MAKKVLVVDDDVSTVKFLTTALEESGYDSLQAFDGKEALELMQNVSPDLILLDIMMPKKTGFTLFHQIRKDEKLKDVPVIMLTGVAETLEGLDAESEDTHERPFDSLREAMRKKIEMLRGEGLRKPEMFLDKPIDPEVVIEKIRELIGS